MMYALFADMNQLIKLSEWYPEMPQENMLICSAEGLWLLSVQQSSALSLLMKLQCEMKIIQELTTDVLLTWWLQNSATQGMN